MTFLTKSDHVVPVVRATVGQLDLVVGKRRRREQSITQAHHAQRVRRKEGRPYPSPRPAITLVAFGVAVIAVISLGFLLGMNIAEAT